MSTAFQKCAHCSTEFRGQASPRYVEENAFVSLLRHMAETHLEHTFLCPRSQGHPRITALPFRDSWVAMGGESMVCSYCGSITPDALFAAIDLGAEIIPTDKSYKIYVRGAGHDHAKFYFEHLTSDQQDRFLALVNAKTIKFAYPGHFYVLPFFARAAAAG